MSTCPAPTTEVTPATGRAHLQLQPPDVTTLPPTHTNPQGIEFDLVQVDLSCKPAWYPAINPRGLVPAVAWQGRAVVESVDIVR